MVQLKITGCITKFAQTLTQKCFRTFSKYLTQAHPHFFAEVQNQLKLCYLAKAALYENRIQYILMYTHLSTWTFCQLFVYILKINIRARLHRQEVKRVTNKLPNSKWQTNIGTQFQTFTHMLCLSLTSQKDVCLHITFSLLYGNKHIVKESKILNQTQKSEEQ